MTNACDVCKWLMKPDKCMCPDTQSYDECKRVLKKGGLCVHCEVKV